MKADKLQLVKTIRVARSIRERIISSPNLPKAEFVCTKCRRLQPFGGDLALHYYGNPGVTLYCNECLGEFEAQLCRELEH